MSTCTAKTLDERKTCTYWDESEVKSDCLHFDKDLNHCSDPWAQAGKKRPDTYEMSGGDTTPEERKKEIKQGQWDKFRQEALKHLGGSRP